MRRIVALATLTGLAALTGCGAPPPVGWCTPPEAYKSWQKDPGHVRLLDVRTPEEYVFIGHAVMARNIPFQFLTAEYDPNRHAPKMTPNPYFLEDVQAACKPEDKLVLMCAGGHRGAAAAEVLRKNGFANVLNIEGGFDGEYKQDCACQGKGELTHRGWVQHGLPWSIWVNPDLLYQRERPGATSRP